MKIVLASASERRQELIKRIFESFDICVSSFDEAKVEFNGVCSTYVMEIAKGKALNVTNSMEEKAVVIGCDTIVSLDGKILGKPIDSGDAEDMLKYLSGKTHQVYSGIAIVDSYSGNIKTDYSCTDVRFSEISSQEIEKYIETGEPFGKAGAYGIQGYGGVFVEEIHGCYYNVVGLPLNKLKKMFREMGVNS